MTEREMLEDEKYWCENCCNWDKEKVQMDAYSTCKLTGTRVFAQESGKECKCFNVPAENVIVPPCKVGDTVWYILNGTIGKAKIEERMFNDSKHGHYSASWLIHAYDRNNKKELSFDPKDMYDLNDFEDVNVYFTKEEAEQALKARDEGK